MVLGWSFNWGSIIRFLLQVSLGAYVFLALIMYFHKYSCLIISILHFRVAIGLAFGVASVLWLGFIFNDTVIEITLTLAVSYVAYFTVCHSSILGTLRNFFVCLSLDGKYLILHMYLRYLISVNYILYIICFIFVLV